jgi:GDPmannose 4,6-dehydratase
VRGETFVTRKITRALASIKIGIQNNLYLGNLDAKRDCGHAKDFVEAQWLMLQQQQPEDFVIATGKQHSVRDFINEAAKNLDMNIVWKGKNLEETGSYHGKDIIKVDPKYFRPTEVETLLGDASKAKKKLNWSPKITFNQLVKEMVDEDLKLAKNYQLINR